MSSNCLTFFCVAKAAASDGGMFCVVVTPVMSDDGKTTVGMGALIVDFGVQGALSVAMVIPAMLKIQYHPFIKKHLRSGPVRSMSGIYLSNPFFLDFNCHHFSVRFHY